MYKYLILFLLIISAFSLNSYGQQNQAPPDYTVRYIKWEGTSPGDKITYTSLDLIEIDFASDKMRTFSGTANDPEPMLPCLDEELEKFRRKLMWYEIPEKSAPLLISLIDSWLKTDPPPKYNIIGGLGTEDGAREGLSISWGKNTVKKEINRRGGYSPDDQLIPPEEWNELVKELTMLSSRQ